MDVVTKVTSKELNLMLWKDNSTISTAESCTGGMIASAITSVPGSSNYFKGGIVSYTEETKMKFLGVKAETIEAHTVYSEEVVKEMVAGAIKAFDTTYAVAVSGIAGPSGGTPEIPVGTIWIAVGSETEVQTLKLTEDNGRERNMQFATNAALKLLREFIAARQPIESE